jgi:hypothetical protein
MSPLSRSRRVQAQSEDTEAEPSRAPAGSRRRIGLPTRPWLQFVVAFGLLSLLLVVVRGNQLWTTQLFNPDEAELMAEGRGAAQDLFPYSGYTSSTHLFLWPFTLGVLDRVGVPLTVVTAHVIGGISYVMLGATGWFLMMRRIGGLRAAFLVLPTTAVLLLGYQPSTSDYLSMTSESLPVVILCVAALVMLGPSRPLGQWRLVAGSLVAGLAMWGKPQSGPVAVALVGACIFVACVERQQAASDTSSGAVLRSVVRSAALAVAAFATPTIVFLLLMQLGGTLDDFAREPLTYMWDYTAHREAREGIVAPALPERLQGVAGFATAFPFAAAWTLGGLLAMSGLSEVRSRLLRALALAAFLLPLAAAVTCLLPIYPLFPHYANFLYAGGLLASCVAARLVAPGQTPAHPRWIEGTYFAVASTIVLMLMVAVVPGNISDLAGQGRRALTGGGLSFANEVDLDATPLATDCPAGSRVLTWGWASELYLSYDWVPASRYVNSTWMINPTAHQAEYGRILVRELEANPPDCIVEALGPAFFSAIDPANTLANVVPGASSLLDSCYTPSAAQTFDGRAVTLYLRTSECSGRRA